MSNYFENHERYSKGKPSHHKKFGGKEYFWAGEFKTKRGVLSHLMAIANNTGYSYRLEKFSEISRFTFNPETRYNLWCRRIDRSGKS